MRALQDDKYYVGCSSDVIRRYKQHQKGQGSSWTQLYPPVDLQSLHEVAPGRLPGFEEDAQVKSLMLIYGIDRVRGGSYSNVELTEAQLAELKQALRHAKSACYRCGRTSHFASECFAKTEIVGSSSSTES